MGERNDSVEKERGRITFGKEVIGKKSRGMVKWRDFFKIKPQDEDFGT